jgi:tRNA A37 N6-isopentenylltransferase MiaA
MESNISENKVKLERVLTAKIPVSEESPIHHYFLARRNIVKTISCSAFNESVVNRLLEELEKLNEEIRKYFYL